jgi:hypothetical protein
VNSRPLAAGPWAEKEPLCPEDLMLGRSRTGNPTVSFETGLQLVKRFHVVQEAKKVFPSLLKQKKWYKYKRDARVCDVVLRKDETAAGQTYKYARIVKVRTDTDSKVWSVDVQFTIPGESKFRVSTRLIHKLVLIVPVEELSMEGPVEPEERKVLAKEEEAHQGMQVNPRQVGLLRQNMMTSTMMLSRRFKMMFKTTWR